MNWLIDRPLFGSLLFTFDLIIRLWLSRRIVARRLPAGVAWAWLSLILFIPFIGTVLYFNFGEYRQSRRRRRRLQAVRDGIDQLAQGKMPPQVHLPGDQADLAKVFSELMGMAPTVGNHIELFDGAHLAFAQLIRDVDQAQKTIDLEFYIWNDGGLADLFADRISAAVKRGVKCRLLVDALGSRQFIKGHKFNMLRQAGVDLVVALPSGFWRSLLARPDLRIHRKIAIIDGSIGYTGSLNLADPKFFNLRSGCSPWVDALARINGPVVTDLYAVFISDWCAETGEDFNTAYSSVHIQDQTPNGKSTIQCLPSGPAVKDSAIEQALIMSLYSARHEIILTTPYFVPSEALLYAITAAARRGVRTTLILPERIDSRLTHYASRSFLPDLIMAGVTVALYKPGLLHTKSVTIDRNFCLFGSLNLDQRSFRINFEITVAVYDETFAQAVCAMQSTYLQSATLLTSQLLNKQTKMQVFKGDLARLVGPLL